MTLFRDRDQDHPQEKEMQKSKMAVWRGLTNSCEKKREKQKRKGKIYPFECKVPEKSKSELQWNITSHWLEWPSSRNPQTINSGEGMEKRECSCSVGVNVNWYSHYGKQYGDSLKKLKKARTKTTI